MSQPIVILNSVKAATELLDRRSIIYSDRPQAVMMRLFVSPDILNFCCDINSCIVWAGIGS